jgi:hypothetical protein
MSMRDRIVSKMPYWLKWAIPPIVGGVVGGVLLWLLFFKYTWL